MNSQGSDARHATAATDRQRLSRAHQGGRGWDDPMLSRALAGQNGLTMNEMIQMRCNFCHRHDAATPAMEEINLAKQLVKKKKCMVCHVVEGRGDHRTRADLRGRPKPRVAELRVRARRTHDVQLERAASDAGERVSPRTQMPDFNLKPEESRALTLLLLSCGGFRIPRNTSRIPKWPQRRCNRC